MLDVHLSGPVVGGALRERGHDVLAVDQSPELREMEDIELLRLAREEGRVIVTSSVGDFMEHVTEWAHAGESHAGGGGNDAVQGGLGRDNMLAQDGNDFLLGGEFGPPAAKDTLSAGHGNDVIDVFNKPAGKDVVSCGGGIDRVFADRADSVAPNCEKVFVGQDEFEAFFDSIPNDFFDNLNPRL